MSGLGLIWFLLIGLIAGWLAGRVMRGGGYGLVGDLIVGVIGALLGGWLFGLLGISAGGLIGALITAFVGAAVLNCTASPHTPRVITTQISCVHDSKRPREFRAAQLAVEIDGPP